METTPIPYRSLLLPGLTVAVAALTVLYAVVFDQGALASTLPGVGSESGGFLHELFHDTRHLLGAPCH